MKNLKALALLIALVSWSAWASTHRASLTAGQNTLLDYLPYVLQSQEAVPGRQPPRYTSLGRDPRHGQPCQVTIQTASDSGDLLFIVTDWIGVTQTLIPGSARVKVEVTDNEIRTAMLSRIGTRILIIETPDRSNSENTLRNATGVLTVTLFQRSGGEAACTLRFR